MPRFAQSCLVLPLIFLGLAVVCTLLISNPAMADFITARSERAVDPDSLQPGIGAKKVIYIVGEPEHKTIKDSSNSESWHYGNSLLFMENGKLVAWSDSGELKELALARKQEREKRAKKRQRKDRESGWIDVWQPSPSLSPKEVLDDILLPKSNSLILNLR
jgi:hypothetical protein